MGILDIFKKKKAQSQPYQEEKKELSSEAQQKLPSDDLPFEEKPLKCLKCGGDYLIREGRYGFFAGCSSYPKCHSTLNLRELAARYIERQGLYIYAWKRTCWKCKKETVVYSYYLGYQIKQAYPDYSWDIMGVGYIPYLDVIIAKKYPALKVCYSRTVDESYMANTCEHCGALQGRNYVVDDPHEIFNELFFEDNMAQYLIDILPVKVTQDFIEQVGELIVE